MENPGSPNAMEKRSTKKNFFQRPCFLSREFQASKIGDYHLNLVCGFNHLKKYVKLEIFPKFRGENNKMFELPPPTVDGWNPAPVDR